MKIALLNTKDTTRARYLFECFARGAALHGDEVVWVSTREQLTSALETCDVGAQVCVANRWKSEKRWNGGAKGAGGDFRIAVDDAFRAAGKRVLVIDTGFVRSQTDYEIRAAEEHELSGRPFVLFDVDRAETYETAASETYYEVGYDGLKRLADYRADGVPGDRWARLDIPLRPWRTRGSHVLVIGQTFRGLSSQHVDIYDWYREVVDKVSAHTDRPIVFRHHPRLTKMRHGHGVQRAEKDAGQLRRVLGSHMSRCSLSRKRTLAEDLEDCWAAVTFTSNGGVIPPLMGVPVFVADPGSMAWDVSSGSLDAIDDPPLPDRERWAHALAYSQWNCTELEDGSCWEHLRPGATEPRKDAL